MRAIPMVRVLAMLVLAGAAAGQPAHALPDVLDRPAVATRLAARSVMLAVTRANQRLVAVGERGLIVLSDDNGSSWRQAQVPVSVSLTNVRFLDARRGLCVGHGGLVLTTEDGGETWKRRLDGRQVAELILDAARKGATGGDAGPNRALADGERLRADGPDKPFLDVMMFDERRGIIVGAFGLAMSTIDGGQSWVPALERVSQSNGRHLYAIQRAPGVVLIAGEQGGLFVSANDGKNFAEIQTPYAGSYFGAVALSDKVFLVYGLRGNAFRTADAGSTWQKLEVGTSNSITAAHVLSDQQVVMVDEAGGVYVSQDAGERYRSIAVPNRFPFTGVVQASDGALILSGTRGLLRVEQQPASKRTSP
ncbi:MAG: WD40/YVTN/BNR-like repeat-containing protein [Pirellulaceae bacterium]